MARRPEPRWYASRGGWYAWIDGRQVSLAVGKGGKEEAWRCFHRLMLRRGESPPPDGIATVVLCDMLLDFVEEHRGRVTYEWYRWHLKKFCERFGRRSPEGISAAEVSRWLDETGWGRSTRHGATTCIKRAYRWGLARGLIGSNPLSTLEGPGVRAREHIPTGGEASALIREARGPLRDLLVVLYETGMRPSEAYRVEAKDIDWCRSVVLFHRHKTLRATGRPRVIYLTPKALDVLRGAAARNPGGPLLRNRAGGPWTAADVSHRIIRIRKRLGIGAGATAGAMRHLFVTDALERGIPVRTVAELVGHRSTRMIEEHYGHLHERSEHLAAALAGVRDGHSSR